MDPSTCKSQDAALERPAPAARPEPELPVTETLSRGSRMTKTESLPERLTFEEATRASGVQLGRLPW